MVVMSYVRMNDDGTEVIRNIVFVLHRQLTFYSQNSPQ